MPRASPMKYSVNAGALSPLLDGRVDQPKYAGGCSYIHNILPTVQGPGIRRGGLGFINEVFSQGRCWLWKFVFNVQQTFQLEFGNQYIKFYTQHAPVLETAKNITGITQANPAVVTSNAHGFANGDTVYISGVAGMSQLNTRMFQVANVTINTFELKDFQGGNINSTGYGAYTSGGTVARHYTIATPWTLSDLTGPDGEFKLKFGPSNDIIYICSGARQVKVLKRFSNTNWTLTDVVFEGGPFLDQNTDAAITVYASAESGTGITLTASSGIFSANMVGSLFYLEQKTADIVTQWEPGKSITAGNRRRSDGKTYEALNTATTGTIKPVHTEGSAYDGDTGVNWLMRDPGYGWVVITGYTSATQVTATVLSRIPSGAVGSGNASYRWAEAVWSDKNGYPTAVTFFRERTTYAKGQRIDMSVPADFENFQPKKFGQVTADSAIKITVQSAQANEIQWLSPDNDLLIGTLGAEFAAGEISTADPLGPSNIRIKDQSAYGGRAITPARVGDSTIFVHRAGRKLRDMSYTFDLNKYASRDLTVLSEHLLRYGVVSMDYQQEPYSILWGCTSQGMLLGFTYNKEQEVLAWHPHPVGSSSEDPYGYVESVVCTPAPDNSRDELTVIVRRTINGVTRRFIEYMRPEFQTGQWQHEAFYLDSGLSLVNSIAATLTPGAGATIKGTAGVTFTAGSAVFSAGDVGRKIHFDWSDNADLDPRYLIPRRKTAVAEITGYTSSTQVTCTIRAAFPNNNQIASGGWRMTVTTVSGLWHLEGQTVHILAGGAAHPTRVVENGAISLQNPASVVHVGFQCKAKLRTMRMEAGSATGTSQGKIKRIDKCGFRFENTLGVKYGADESRMNEIQFRPGQGTMDEPPELFSGDKIVQFPEGYSTDGYVTLVCEQPFPCTITAIMPNLDTQD